ncbi:MAG TPA: efflux RND transporter periplasmic adaptor subunit [Woeseiaceae bacterium]|nr:efflux RND transporter periplasmic adaptor subunit [Woeseiaceae bacterium]
MDYNCGRLSISMHIRSIFRGFGLSAVLVLLAACEQDVATGTQQEPGPVKVVTYVAQSQRLLDEVQALGTARANESIEIRPRISSIVTRVAFTEGQLVREGDLLIELENSEIRAGLAVAEAALSESRSTYNRSESLASTQAISASSLEQLRATMQVNEAQVAAARARLENTVIRAPFGGRVGLRRVSPGGFVDTSTVITTLDDTDIIKLDFSIPETFLTVVSSGMNIAAQSLVYPDRTFTGTVDSVDTRLDPVARSVQVRAVLENPDGALKPGMFLTVDLQRDRGDVLVAPEEAIVPEREEQFVFQVVDGKAVKRQVSLGRRVPGLVEVTGGISAGDILITEGTHKIRDGSLVEVVKHHAAEGIGGSGSEAQP